MCEKGLTSIPDAEHCSFSAIFKNISNRTMRHPAITRLMNRRGRFGTETNDAAVASDPCSFLATTVTINSNGLKCGIIT